MSQPKRNDRGGLLLSIDLEPHANILRLVLHVLVHTCGTESVLDTFVLRPLHLGMFIPILNL